MTTAAASQQRRIGVLKAIATAAVLIVPCLHAFAFDQFQKPTAEELAMTSLPGYPGAPAVILDREEITKDHLHVVMHYDRIKILTEEGKKYANVELGFYSSTDTDLADDKMIGEIVGRTIHADGKVIPFTGKPYLKVIEKGREYKVQQKVFTLPDVEVGSIIEYRYNTRFNDGIVEPPTWFVQDDLLVKRGHFQWYPTSQDVTNEDGKLINSIAWAPILPAGAVVQRKDLMSTGQDSPTQMFELNVKDIPPRLKEEYMPPIGSYSYRVRFSLTPYRTRQEFWTSEGKRWSKHTNSFETPNGTLTEATRKIIGGATTPDEKLRRIYAAVMKMENTRYTRDRDQREDKAAGMGKVNNVSDVFARGRGSASQLTQLFIGMARAAGFNAYAMLVPDRSEEFFTPDWMSFSQFDDVIAIVNVDGKDQFFDPGSRYCSYGQLAWQHTFLNGLRQTDGGGSDFAMSAGTLYSENRTGRTANLTMDEHGSVQGTISLSFLGAPALEWRQTALRGDDEGLKKSLRETLESVVPKGLEVQVQDVNELEAYDKPLVVNYKISGTLATAAGKRMMIPSDLFLAGQTATFPHEKRELAVYFHYPQVVQDAVRVNFPSTLSVEAAPATAKLSIVNQATYSIRVTQAPTSVTTRRDFAFGGFIVPTQNYGELRSFYSQFESKDQENFVLKAGSTTASNTAAPALTK